MPTTKPTNIVTGAFGFIGSYLARYLAEHHTNSDLVLVDYAEAMTQDRLAYMPDALAKAEVLPLGEFETVDWEEFNGANTTLYHLAANSSTKATAEDLMHPNFELVADLADEFKGNIVFASSMSIYGNTQTMKNRYGHIYPQSPYAMSKRSAEFTLARTYQDRNGSTVIARLANVFGRCEGHKHFTDYNAPVTYGGCRPSVDMRSLPYRVLEGLKIPFGEIEVYQPDNTYARDFVYVKRAVEAMVAASKSVGNTVGLRVLEVGHGEPVTWEHLAKTMANAYELIPEEQKNCEVKKLTVTKTDKKPNFGPGYQKLTCTNTTELMTGLSTRMEDFQDMFREEAYPLSDWGPNYSPAMKERMDKTYTNILRKFE